MKIYHFPARSRSALGNRHCCNAARRAGDRIDVPITEEILTLAKQKMEESAGLIFKDVPMLVESKIVDSWE